MGCNCNKKRTAVTAPKSAERKATQNPPPANQLQQQPRSGTGGTQQFALQLNTGKTLKFGSKLEADAENVRRNYAGVVKPI